MSACLVLNVIPSHHIILSTGYRGAHCEDESGIKCPLEQLKYFPTLRIIGEIGNPVGTLETPTRMWVEHALSPITNLIVYLNGPTIVMS